MTWVYVLGERSGEDIKIGRTSDRTLQKRLQGVNGEQTTAAQYVLLAAVRGDPKDETAIKDHFADLRRGDKGRRTEYFFPKDELVEYAAWLRAQWWTAIDPTMRAESIERVESEHWLPGDEWRRIAPPVAEVEDQQVIVPEGVALDGPLAGTPWAWFPDPRATIQDYFTPPEIVDAAREGMGGIDLDAASHYLANQKLRIPSYFTVARSAFENDWAGRVWLNPPYKDNDPWFRRSLEFIESGAVTQMCWLSPVHVFNTQISREFMARVKVMILLSPTPKFWGNKDPAKTGTNLPHAIVYVGDREAEVVDALRPFGMPMKLLEGAK